MKKVLSLFLTVVMALSMFSCLTVVSFAATSDLVIDQEYTVASETTLTFIPEESGSYLFQSFGYGDPRITINCVNGEYEFDDDNDMDFYGIVDLEAGEEVSCYLYNYDDEDCVFEITKIATPNVSFNFVEPVTIVENTNGYWDSGEYWDDEAEDWVWVDYYYYYMPSAFYEIGNTITVEYPDGTTEVYTCDEMGDYVSESGDWLDYDYDGNQNAESHWTLGSDNCFYIEVVGKKIKVPVTIVENPCESIEFIPAEPLVVMENMGGYTVTEEVWDEATEEWVEKDYYKYSVSDFISVEGNEIVVNYNDGTSDSYTYQEYYFEGEDYYDWDFVNESGERLSYDYYSGQDYYNQWTIGSDNYFTFAAFGREIDIFVTVTENPYESIEFVPAKPLEIIENTNGDWDEGWYWDENDNEVYVEYYRYSVSDLVRAEGNKIAVKHKDGTIEDFFYDYDIDGFVNASGESIGYWDYYNEQSYDEQWTLGSDNYFTLEALGKQIPVYVTIIESPVESIAFNSVVPLVLVENVGGEWTFESDEAADIIGVEFFRYDVSDILYKYGNTITVNYNDGTSETYTFQEYYDEEYGYCDEFVNNSGVVLDWDWDENQSCRDYWEVGSDNYFIITCLGKDVEVPVTIIENPYESIEFIPAKPFEIVEKTNGYWEEDCYWDDEAENEVYVDYYRYDVDDLISAEGNTVIVNYKDGTSDSYTYQECYNEEEDYYFYTFVNASGEALDYDYSSNQGYSKQWTLGSDNYFIFEAFGKEAQVPVTIIENPYESIEFIPVNPLYFGQYTNGYWTTFDDEEFFYYDVYELINTYGNIIRLNKKDGTSEEYKCSWHSFDWGHGYAFVNSDGECLDYDYDSNNWYWYAGNDNNYITISANGVECTVYVTITAESTTIQESSFVAEKVSEDTCVITEIIESDDFGGTLDIPETVSGCTVIGIDDGVLGNVEDLKTVNLPASFNMISEDTFNWCDGLEAINVSADNAVFASVNGILYNKALTEIIYCPQNFKGVFVIKAGVTDIPSEALVGLGNASSVQIEAGNTAFAQEDGILYNADFTKIYKAFDVEGDYVMKSTVEEVADYAFGGMDKIESVAFASGVTEISYGAFSGCTALESVDLPDALVSIGIDAFSNNTKLSSVTFPASTQSLEENAFRDCSSLQVINLNNGIEYIGVDAFNNADIRKLVLPDSLIGMGSRCFGNNANLSEVTIGAGLTSIAGSAFEDCSALKNIDIPENITYLGRYAFAGSGLTSVTLHDDIVDIEYAFLGCTDLKSVYIGSGIEYMQSAFWGCSNLEDVEIADGFNGDSRYAFVNCTKLEDVELPVTVTEISYGQFKGCANIDEFDLPDDLLVVKAHSFDNTGLYNNHADGVVYVDHVAYGYKGTMPANYKAVIKEGTKSIAESAFENKTNLVSVQFPKTLEYVGDYAFDGCSSLTTIYGVKDTFAEEYAVEYGYEFIAIEGHIHTPSDWIIDKKATCTEAGSKHKECTDCGETLETAVITATGHTAVKDAAVPATCTTAGKTEGSHCSVCNTVIKAQQTVPAKGHTAVKDAAVPATCTTAGKTEGSHCSVCNAVIVAQQTVPAKGHTASATKYDAVKRLEYEECTVCKVVLESKYIPVPATKITSCYNEVKGVQLKWNAVADATKYEIYRKTSSQSNWTKLTTVSTLAYQDTAVTGNTIYQYKIKAVDQYGNASDYSAQRECRFIATPTLKTRESAVGGIKITWEKVAGATSYRIYRRGAGTDYWYYLGDVSATQNTFFDKESSLVSSGNYYRYTVRASYSGKDSAGKDYLIYSGFDTNGLYLKYVATPKLTSISNATGGLQIKWNAVNGNGRMEYRVYRRGAGSTSWTYLGTTTGTTWTDTKIANANGSYYRYTVRAVQGTNGNGWYSAFDTSGLFLMRLANPTLKSAVSSKSGITVKWSAVKGATSYYVYRKTASSGWTRIATVNGNTNTTYLDKTAKKGVTYVYTVRAVYGKTTSWFNSGISCKDKY